MLTFLAHPKINRIKDTALKDLSISGQTRFSVSFNAIKPEDKALKLSNIKADATLSEAVVSGLPLEQTLSQAELVVAVEDKQTQISGSGLISDIPADFSFNTDEKQSFNLQLKLNDSELLPDWLARRFNWPVKGSAGARLSISKDEGQSDLRVHIKSDVTDLVLQNETFEWAKLQGETGLVNLQLVFGDGRLKSIEDMDIDTSSLKAKGRVSLDEEGVPSFGLLEDVRFPGTELNSILFERSQDARIKFTAEGKTLNLQPLRRDSTLKKGQNIAFDVTADRIVIGPKISFSGALTGATQPDGNGTAALQGSLYVASEPLITESSLDVRFGPSGEYLLGTGLIGGAEVSLNYGPDDTGQLKLELSAQNGGRVLMGLGITDAIRQGQLTMTSRFDDDSFERYRTEFNLEDFVVIEAPAAVRMFSVLSLAGLYGLVEGEGTQFAKGQAVITSQGPIHKLEQVRAAGNAVGLALVGSVNKQTREIDVSGNLVPANQISRLIGQVPLVGQILTGVDKTGLFSTQFSMKGTIEEPDVNVNALALAPGLLRDLFSPDWLGAEGRRILGDEEPQ